ncbi:unnamed protein product [Urochloa humidicola]
MGSAFSSTAKVGSSSLLMIGRAAKVVGIVLLLFVAGSVATLHRADSSQPWIPPRKILRAEVGAAAGRTRRNRCANQHRRPVSGRQQLPRGLAHKKTNLEMEPSLAGRRPRVKDEGSSRSAGGNAEAEESPGSARGHQQQGGRRQAGVQVPRRRLRHHAFPLRRCRGAVGRHGVVGGLRAHGGDGADQVVVRQAIPAPQSGGFFWDEDIEVDAFDPTRYLNIVRREGLEVSQPALDRRSEIHHAITARALSPTEDGVHRRVRDARCGDGNSAPPCVRWVEGMVSVFSRAAWQCTWGMVQNDLIHGWGLDHKLGYFAGGDRALTVGVIDSEYDLHRGVHVLGGASKSAGQAAVRHRASKEMRIFHRRWEKAVVEDKAWKDPFAAESAREPSSG